jgi:hypothetical protein
VTDVTFKELNIPKWNKFLAAPKVSFDTMRAAAVQAKS